MMGWYKNQGLRHAAKKAGLERPRTGGIGDRISDRLEATVDALEVKVERGEARKVEEQDKRDAAKGAKRSRKAARKAARHGAST